MGNSLGGRKTTKVMKINGETMKFTKPMYAGEIMKDYPGHVLLDSEAVKHFGTRAKELEAEQELKPKRLYFLVELPKLQAEERVKATRRVRSGIQMSAKDRLESLMLTRRSISDLSIMKSSQSGPLVAGEENINNSNGGGKRLKLRLPKAEVERLMMESRDEKEAAQKLMDLCLGNKEDNCSSSMSGEIGSPFRHQPHCQEDVAIGMPKSALKSRHQKRVGFMPVNEAEIQLLATT